MRKKIVKAILPVAGLGTRFLPATKSIPKEILSLVDKPLVQYAIDEARAAGIKEFIFVTSRGKGALEDYFDSAPQLQKALLQKNKTDLLNILQKTTLESGAAVYIRQHTALGLGHAVWCARRLIRDEPFAVILPDDVIASDKPCLQQMVEAYQETGGNMVAVMEVPQCDVSSYGLINYEKTDSKLLHINDMVEKPNPMDAQTTTAIIGRYILTPNILDRLGRGHKDAQGEIQLTDAIAAEVKENANVYGYRFEGQRYDCGSKAGFLKATVAFALAREDLRDDLVDFLQEQLATITETE